ncbi:uncharacterized protein LOC141796248 [Halichoeres trimaculatus]|uniref:uncharacterized protein LOC141796248 n=1 Tax=Halichoeres trimaculatus TaxID=147232 RepID=UPI003D9EA4BD
MRGHPTPAWDSGNSTIYEDYTDIAFVAANCLILLITSVVGVGANIFVILAVYNQKSLQSWNNALVVNLAVIDILRCTIDCPLLFTIIITVHLRGRLDKLVCDAQVASFSFSCCIQLLTLACISAERYQAIAQPFKTNQRKKRIMLLIPLTWTVAILVAGFCLIFLKDSPVHAKCTGLLEERSPTYSYDTFGLYMLFPLWAICFAVIIRFYGCIFLLVRSHNRKIFDKGILLVSKKDKVDLKPNEEATTTVEMGTGNPEQSQIRRDGDADVLTQVEPDSSKRDSKAALLTSAEAPQSVPVSLEDKKKIRSTIEITDLEIEHQPSDTKVKAPTEEKSLKTECSNSSDTKPAESPSVNKAAGSKSSTTEAQKVSSNLETEKQSKEGSKTEKAPSEMKETRPPQVENPESTSVLQSHQKQPKKSDTGNTLPVITVDPVSSLPPVSINTPEPEAAQPNIECIGAVCMMPSKAQKERANKKKESKLAKRAGYICVTFLLFWLPLITTILVNVAVHRNKNTPMKITQHVEILSMSIACITSLSDPIIYAAVNPQFRTEFFRIKNRIESIFNKK